MSPPALERLHERRIPREVREQTQLDLRVVGGEERPALSRNESAPNVAAELAANRNVLEIRIARREAAGRRDRLVERRVQPPRVADARSAGSASMYVLSSFESSRYSMSSTGS